MEQSKIDTIKKAKSNPLFEGLDDDLKSVESYESVEKELLDIIKTTHKHKFTRTYQKCGSCKDKFHKRRNRILSLGFKNYIQYVEWKRVMNIIKNNKKIRIA